MLFTGNVCGSFFFFLKIAYCLKKMKQESWFLRPSLTYTVEIMKRISGMTAGLLSLATLVTNFQTDARG